MSPNNGQDNDQSTSELQTGHITLALGSAQLAPWLPLVHDLTGQKAPPKTGILVDHSDTQWFPPLAGIDASIGSLDLFGQSLSGLKMSAKASPSGWQVVASAKEFEGTIDFYPNWMSQGLKVAASRWYLTGVTAPADAAKADLLEPGLLEPELLEPRQSSPPQLPPLVVNVEDFRFFDKPFGKLQLQAGPHAAGYQIQTLSLNSENVSVQGSGMWHQFDGQNKTELTLRLSAKQFNHLSAQLGIDPGLNQAPLTMDGALSWQGAPYEFALETLNGAVKFDLGKGHLSQVSDKGTRIFSLFSLDSLVRKLSLDFSDVFGQGLYFNRFTGNLQIDHGVVKTTDTEMDAIAGNIKVRGFTDLTSESLNYDIRFVPQLASSVPTVVLLSTSAWTLGLGAFALTKVLEPVIEVISEIRFRVTGTVAQPVLEELERKSKEIEIPEAILPIVGERGKVLSERLTPPPPTPAAPLLQETKVPEAQAKEVQLKEAQAQNPPQARLETPLMAAPFPYIVSVKAAQPAINQKLAPFANEQLSLVNLAPIPALTADAKAEDKGGQVARVIQLSEGDKHAYQSAAMSEWSGRRRQSAVYPIAA
ncbi:MAG: AsmA-like C-terminal region-containing protein, partial [Shewanella sp.]